MSLKTKLLILLVLTLTATSCRTTSKTGEGTNALLSDTTYADQYIFRYLNETDKKKLAWDTLARSGVSASTNIIKLAVNEITDFATGYRYDVRRAEHGKFRRRDTFRLTLDLDPGSLIFDTVGKNLPVYFRITSGQEVQYSRLFESSERAFKALPKTFMDLPLNSKKAKMMAVGDVVVVPVTMGFELGIRDGMTPVPFRTTAAAGIFWAGNFRITISRVDYDRFRVFIDPVEERGLFARANVALDLHLFGYGPFGVVNIDNQVERALRLGNFLAYINRNITDAEKFHIDYTFNLNDQTGYAEQAYDAILLNTLKIAHLALGAKLVGQTRLSDITLGSLNPAEYLHNMDKHLPVQQRRVTRGLETKNIYSGTSEYGHFGTKILRWKTSRRQTVNFGTLINNDNESQNYFFPMYEEVKRTESLMSPLRKNNHIVAAAVFLADSAWKPVSTLDLVFALSRTEKLMTFAETMDYVATIEAILGQQNFVALDFARPFGIINQSQIRNFKSEVKISISGWLFQKLYKMQTENPAEYQRYIYWAIYQTIQKFDLRDWRNRAPQNLVYDIGNFFRLADQEIRSLISEVIRFRWGREGVHGRTINDIIALMWQIGTIGDVNLAPKIMGFMKKDYTASEIVPSFFVSLCEAYRMQPYIHFQYSANEIPLTEKHLGTDPHVEHHRAVGKIIGHDHLN